MVSQSVRQGTVAPTHYNVIHDTTQLKPDHMQRLAYKLCHLYYNWPVGNLNGCVNYAITAPNYVYYYYYSYHFVAIIHANTIKIRLWLYCIQLYVKFVLTDAGPHNNRALHLSCCLSNVSIFQPVCTRK